MLVDLERLMHQTTHPARKKFSVVRHSLLNPVTEKDKEPALFIMECIAAAHTATMAT